MSLSIPKCGYNRNTKREIIFGPHRLGGANFRHLYDQQGLGQLTLFLRNWRQNSEAGKLLKCVVAWAQYTTGMATPILETPAVALPHLEAKWLKSLRQYLRDTNAAIQVDSTGQPQLERKHDGYIMECIVQSQQFSEKEIVRLNYCRLFLNAVTISDLTSTRGDRLDPGKLVGQPSLDSTTSKWLDVLQDKPSATEWELWTRANRLWSDEEGKLYQPLGRWIQHLPDRRIQHFAYQCHHNLFVLRNQHGYIKYRMSRSGTYKERTGHDS